jgi:Xaa-Pro aminopeptidase
LKFGAGYYKTGAYGIRVENLVTVVEQTVQGTERRCCSGMTRPSCGLAAARGFHLA